MFVKSGQLAHLLKPEAYSGESWFASEQQSVFRRSWQFFCLANEVARDGDRFARQVCDTPVVVSNSQGQLRALHNVCAHRHSQIAPSGCSHSAELTCPIHGWKYDAAGKLKHLPDGRSFVGVKAGDLALPGYRVEQVGALVFVNLTSEGPSFREHLGTLAGEFEQYFGNVEHIHSWVTEHPINWKVVCENAVESYHVPMVHPQTFEDYRAEELHDHRLEPTYTRYGDLLPYEAERSLTSRIIETYTRWIIANPSFKRFSHTHIFPNMLLYYGDIFSGFTSVEPLGPNRCIYRMMSFVPKDIRWGKLGWLAQRVTMSVFLRMVRKILREDMDRWGVVHEGLRNSPHRGVLSAREERVFAFQEYLLAQMQSPPASV